MNLIEDWLVQSVPVSRKASKPAWYKNTYFWISGILFILGLAALVMWKPELIRDPGQKREADWLLITLYFGGSVIMLLNGYLSHRQTVQHYHEMEETEKS